MVGYCTLKLMSYFSSDVATMLPQLNCQIEVSNEKARKDLGIEFSRPIREFLTETAMSLIKLGLVEDKKI